MKHTLFPTGFEQRGRDGKVAYSTDTGTVEAPIYIIQYAPTGFEQRERDGRGRLLMSHRRGGKGEKGEGCKTNIQYEKSTVARKLF